jgi:hypothetical protein
MDNSLVTHLSAYIHALFKDLAWLYSRPSELERDKTRLLSEVEVRGLRILTIDLPSLCKHFDRCLDEGLYTPSSLPLSSKVSKRVHIPAFMREMYLQIFDSQGVLREKPSIDHIRGLRMFYASMGKPKMPCKKEMVHEEVNNFFAIEQELRTPSLNWDGDDLFSMDHNSSINVCGRVSFADISTNVDRREPVLALELDDRRSPRLHKHHATILQQVCDRIASSFGDFHSESPHELPQHGRGRVSNHSKEESKYSFTEWSDKLDAIFPYDLYATTNLFASVDRNRPDLGYRNFESPSKLIAVPKTMSGPRLIASEPNQHQFLQQLIRNQIEGRIVHTVLKNSISFGNQKPNRLMAVRGSRYGKYATVDLKSASDRLTCWTVERAFRSNQTWLERLHACRTRMLRNGISNKPFNLIKLKKMFSQGSACTFPVQSVVYAMISISSVLISEGKKVTSQSLEEASRLVRVFGDDIIIPGYALETLTDILTALQLKVNSNKTFSKGKFRESCGIDAYDGHNVTPVRIRHLSLKPKHENAASVLETSNNLFENGYWNLAAWLDGTLKGYSIPTVFYSHGKPSTQGRISFLQPSKILGAQVNKGFKTRFSLKLHRWEILIHKLTSKSVIGQVDGWQNLYQFFIDRPQSSWYKPTHFKAGVLLGNSSVMKRGWHPLDLI